MQCGYFKKVTAFLLFFCLYIGSVKADDYRDIVDNSSLENSNNFGYCDDCEYTTPDWHAGASTIYLVTPEGEKVKLTYCSSLTASRVGTNNCIVNDDIPNPLNNDGTTNQEYHDYWNNWLDSAIQNGELNDDSEAAKMIADAFCKDGFTEQCKIDIERMVANSQDDNMDFVVFPGQTVCSTSGECAILNNLVTDLCSGNYPGMNKVLCQNVAESCLSGSATDYQKENFAQGSSGICTYDSFAELLDQSCEGYCEYRCGLAGGGDACTSDCIKKDCEVPEDEPEETPTTTPGKCKLYTCAQLYGTAGCTEKNQTLPQSIVSPASCGVNYYKKSYEWGGKVDSCGTTDYIIETTVSISVPSKLNATIYTGQGFNWGGFSGVATVAKKVGNTSNLVVKQNQINTELTNVQITIGCKREELNETLSEDMKSCGQSMSNCMRNCSETNKTCEGEDCQQKYNLCTSSCYTSMSNCSNAAQTKYSTAIEKLEDEEEKLKEPYETALEDLQSCATEIANAKTSTQTYTNFTESAAVMTLGDYKQTAGSIKSIDKNSGLPSSSAVNDNSFANEYDFFIPYYLENNTSGTLTQSVTSPFASVSVHCPVTIKNDYVSPGGDINLIYRPISLTNPFPNSNSNDFRKTIGYWSKGVTEMIILNNREVNDYEVYDLVPMYTITLTPTDIKKIREYNKKNSYSDFNLECEDGLYCRSNFLWSEFNYLINQDKSCAMSNEWYACDSEYYASARDELLKYLK